MEQNMEGQAEYSRDVRSSDDISGWGVGFIMFAAFMMMLMGGFHAFSGLVAIIDDAFYVTPREYFTDFSPETWGWAHLVAGIIVFSAGIALLGGAVWARLLAIVIAFLSALVNFAFIPYYPVWSIIMIAVAIGVIWALIAHGRDLEAI
jgi:hypothetical protein